MTKRTPVLFPALLFALSAFAQTSPASAPSDPPMPKDPNALMQLAARVNGLGSPDMQPWHLKANYQTFDADGKPKEQGVFEEWWAAPDKYKISYTSPSFNQTQYHSGGKTWLSGDKGLVPFRDTMLETFLVHPLPTASDIEKGSYIVANKQLGQVPLVCAGRNATALNTPPGATYCFDNQKPVLPLEQTDGNLFVLFDDVIRTVNHYVDKQITIQDSRAPIVKAEVTDFEFPNTMEDSVLATPASATVDERLTVKAGVMVGKKVGGEDIKYPPMARQQRIEGSVMLVAVITKLGDIADLDVITGPKELRKSSIDAVKTWKYTPYLLNGQPVEVRTEINVDYTLSR